MHPLIEDFVAGESCLLVAMGPTSSGKTHTIFGNFSEPGLIPRGLKKLLAPDNGNDLRTSRSYFLSMFEICSERGRGEKILDLFQCGAELSMQQLNIKGLQEIAISSVEEAESLLTQGMSIRTTAATNANSQSSRSQCIINVRSSPKVVDGQRNECKLGEAVLTIADLAGAEREKKTGNQGVRLNESNFINNTSMVFGLCLRALLEHQKNPKRALEKHYKSSFLTRYLKNYFEGKRRMVMVLNVSPGEDNYTDTSFVLRQASPYVNIKFTTPSEELPNLPRPKRSSSMLSKGLQPRRKKFRLSQEPLAFKHGTGPLNCQSLEHRTIEDKVHVGDSIAFGKDGNFFGSVSSVHAPVRGAEHAHIRESSSVLIFSEEQLKEKISKMEDKVNVVDSIAFGKDKNSSCSLLSVHASNEGEEQTHVRGPSSFLNFTEEQRKERISKMKDKVIVKDFVAIVKDKNSSCSLPSVHAPGQGEVQSHIRDSLVLITEEQLQERISFAVEEQVKEQHKKLLEEYEMILSSVLKEHHTKIKMMENHGEELELELKKEREHSLELSNELSMLKECCASLECENEKLQMAHKSGNIIMYTESNYENSQKLLLLQDVLCQNDVKAKSLIRSDCNNNALSVADCEFEAISNSCQSCKTVGEEELSCTGSENNEGGEVNCETSLAVYNKSGRLSTDGFEAFESVALREESTTQPCKATVYLPGAKSNFKKGRMLASLLLNRKVEDGVEDINRNAIEFLEEIKETSESTSEDDVGPIGQCLEELLGLSPSEIENGLWKGDIECKRKISDVLERHGGILDLHSFKKGYSQQRSLCLRYCFSLICNKTLSEDANPKSRQKIFWAIARAQTVGKAASHARRGLQQEGLFKNANNCCPSPGSLVEAQDSQIDSGSSYQTNFPSTALLLNPENIYLGNRLESLECNNANLCSSTKSPRRKLLPTPSMLVEGIDEGTVEDEIPKVVDRSVRKHSSLESVVGTRGRMSLARLLAGNR